MYFLTNEKKECCGCRACIEICPIHCIVMKTDEEGFNYPVIDNSKCVKCKKCVSVCPILNPKKQEVQKVFGGTTNKNEIVKQSSSGGIYPIIAKNILDSGGVVYAVALNSDLSVSYKRITNKSDIALTQGSKYVQCNITSDIYELLKIDIKNNLEILFVGTPCQVSGIKNLFNYNKLYTVDFICHGVPSNLMLNKYIEMLEKKHNGKVVDLNFRNKDKYGWSITLSYDIKKKNTKIKRYYLPHKLSGYFVGFLHGLTLRESCYNCKFCSSARSSDITLSDFWGCEKFFPELINQNGVSLVMTSSENGNNIIDSIMNQGEVMLKCLSLEKGLSKEVNTNLGHPTIRKDGRNTIYIDVNNQGFKYIEKKYFRPLVSIKERVILSIPYSLRKKIKNIIKK